MWLLTDMIENPEYHAMKVDPTAIIYKDIHCYARVRDVDVSR